MSLGEKLKKYRKDNKRSMAEIAAITGIPADRLYKWEKGTKPSLGEDILKIEELLAGKLENVPTGNVSTGNNIRPPVLESLLIRLMEQQVQAAERANQLMELQNRLIKDTVEPVKEKINNIDAKTENLWNGLTAHVIRQGKGQEILFDSLEHLRGLTKGDLKRELDNKVADLLRVSGTQDIDHSMGKDGIAK